MKSANSYLAIRTLDLIESKTFVSVIWNKLELDKIIQINTVFQKYEVYESEIIVKVEYPLFESHWFSHADIDTG
jgi:hypothetical protein